MPKKRSHGDGALYYVKSRKLWRGVVDLGIDPETGKRKSKQVTSRSQAECRAKLRELQRQVEEHGAPLDNTATVAEWAPLWLEEHKKPDVDPKTYSGYASAVRRWITPTIGHKRISALKPSDITAIRTAITKAGRSSTTALHTYRTVSMMLDDARKEGLCARNVALDVTPPRKAATKRGAIPLEQAAYMLELAASHDLGSMWWFKLLGGPRQSEILGATLDGLDLDAGVYRVNWSLEEVPKDHGCGQNERGEWLCEKRQGASCPQWQWRIPDGFEMQHMFGRWALTRPKSATGRAVPLIPQLQTAIAEYLERHEDEPNPYGLIWRDSLGNPYRPKDDAQAWRNLLHAAGAISEDQLAPGKSNITGHWARHTTVTLLASLGVDAQIIGEIVGHSSEEVTRIYRHVHATEKTQAMERLGGLMLGEPKALGA